MNIILISLDAVLCLLAVGAAAEYLRRINPMREPALSIAFYLVAIGAFGSLAHDLRGETPSAFVVIMHAGVVLYAWVRRRHIFEWGGVDRRRVEHS